MILLNAIILPFAGENIVTASAKPKELFIIKRLFEDNLYKSIYKHHYFLGRAELVCLLKGLPFVSHLLGILQVSLCVPSLPYLP